MTVHDLTTEEAVPSPEGFALKSWCACDLLLTGRAGTARKARRILWLKVRDHRGQARAAGPGRAA